MNLSGIIRELLPLVGGQTFEDRLFDVNLAMKRSNRNSKARIRAAVVVALAWIPIIAWAGTALYRSTARKDELLAEKEVQARAAAGTDAAVSSPHPTP